jgi:protein-disulfide isomerase
MIDRRALLIAGAGALAGVRAAIAQGKDFVGDDGKPAQTWRLPSQIAIDPEGVIAAGGKSPDAILTEFFDYNCPWCKKSAADLDRLVSTDKNFSLRLVQNPVLSLGSVQAAKVALAVRALAGDDKAYRFHRALLARRGQVTGQEALAEAAALKLDAKAVEDKADSEEILLQLKKHTAISRALGMEATPSFAIVGMGIAGWPGGKSIQRLVKDVRACDALAC